MCHLQGPKLRHVVETGHRKTADVVVVEGAEEREEQKTTNLVVLLNSYQNTGVYMGKKYIYIYLIEK